MNVGNGAYGLHTPGYNFQFDGLHGLADYSKSKQLFTKYVYELFERGTQVNGNGANGLHTPGYNFQFVISENMNRLSDHTILTSDGFRYS